MKRKGPQQDMDKERFWRDVIRRQQRSGQSIRGFCRQEGLSEPSFYAWRHELKQRGGSQRTGQPQRRPARRPAFVSVQLAAGTIPTAVGPIECLLPSGVVLRLPPEMEPAAIASLLRSWERSPC